MIQDTFISILNSYNSTDFFQAPDIPRKKLKNANKNYPVRPGEEILALIDATVMGSAKCGLIIGTHGISWANDWTTATKKRYLSWQELASKEAIFTITDYNIEFLPGCMFNMSGSSYRNTSL